MNNPKTRTRKSPANRSAEILDSAIQLVIREGVLKATMNSIAQEAGVSKALLYTYFRSRIDLLQAALLREHDRHVEAQRHAIRTATNFEEMARTTQRNNEDSRRGLLLDRLKADPEIRAAVLDLEQKGREDVVNYLSKTIINHFSLPKPMAIMVVHLLLGYEQNTDPQEQAEVWGAMMQGAMLELQKRYGENSKT